MSVYVIMDGPISCEFFFICVGWLKAGGQCITVVSIHFTVVSISCVP